MHRRRIVVRKYKWARRTLVILWALLCLQLVTCSTAETDKLMLAFVSNKDGYEQIYLVNADGSGLRQLTNGEGRNWSPAWSPNGHKIAYTHEKDGNWDIYAIDVSGGDVSRLTSDPGTDDMPAWSPDGSKIAFMSNRGGNFQLYLMNADGTGQRRLINGEEQTAFPSWSPDGRKIAFAKEHTVFKHGLTPCVLEIDSGKQTCPLPELDDTCSAFTWSPDGTQLAFCSSAGLYVVNVADGSFGVPVKPVWNLAWSPTGNQIAYTTTPDIEALQKHPVRDLYVMNSDGTNQRAIVQLPSLLVLDGPAWSQDGNMLAFAIGEGDYGEDVEKLALYVVRSDGRNLKKITSGQYLDRSPVWAPQ